ncbi:glutamate receptor ionotropic, kainate 2-like, partial [Hyalella azteca]|uniref:Glutamate receptor ionotropic, kainate 2-like n=1 Tax=Hyalella azteca TaxID=294128 RepID=A0A8B7NV13_HYAAZ
MFNLLRNWRWCTTRCSCSPERSATSTRRGPSKCCRSTAPRSKSGHLEPLSSTTSSGLSCTASLDWCVSTHVLTLNVKVELYGFSGLVRFNADGARSDVKLDVVALTEGGLRVIGRWDPIGGANFTLPGDSAARRAVKSMRNSQLKILSILSPPFAMRAPEGSSSAYEGISVDLAREISRLLGFNYTFNPALDEYGEFNPTQQRWTGLTGEIVEK